MRVKNFIIFWLWLAMCQLAPCNSSKSSEFASATNVLRIIEPFTVEKGHLPSSWEEIDEFYNVSQIAGSFKYQERFGFLEQPIQIDHYGITSEVVVMSLDGNGEGRVSRETAQDDGVYEAGRILILYRQPDIFEIVRFNEEALARAFNRAENSLADYTGVTGKWANTSELLKSRESVPGLLESTPNTNRNPDARSDPKRKATEHRAKKSKEDEPDVPLFQVWLIGVLVICLLGILVFILRRKLITRLWKQ